MSLFFNGLMLGLSLAVPIGPINLEIIRRGLAKGVWTAWLVGVGAVAADMLYLSLALAGASVLFESAWFRIAIGGLGGLYLCYIGVAGVIAAWKGNVAKENDSPAKTSERNSFVEGFVIVILNPLAIVFWFTAGSAAVLSQHAAGVASGSVYIGGLLFGVLAWCGVIATAAGVARAFVTPRVLRVVSLIGSLVILYYGLFIIYTSLSA
jgi:threonine/homoserine/homoserine lactone efflux protein